MRLKRGCDRYLLRGCYVDDFTTDPGSGGDTFGADDIGGVKFPRVKLIIGADGTNDGDVAAGNPLPISASALTTLATVVKAEDAASAGGDPGIVVMGLRQDVPAAKSGTDGDYEPFTIKGGRLVVDASGISLTVASHDVTNAGTFAVQAAQSGTWNIGTVTTVTTVSTVTAVTGITNPVAVTLAAGATAIAKAEDVASADNDVGVPAMAVRKATPANTSGTDGDYEFLQMSAGRLWASATIDAALPAGTNAIGKLAANSGVDIGDVDVTSIAAGDNNIGNVDIVTMPNVTLAAGTNTNEVVGDVAHDAAAAGNPVMVAGVAQDMDDTAPPNAVSAEGDSTRLATDRAGAIFAHPHGPRVWSYHSDGSSALTDATVHATPGSGLSLYVTDIIVSTGAATAMNVFFEEGSTKVLGPFYLEAVAGRGLVLHFVTPKKITPDTALTVTTSAAIAQCVDVTGFTAQG